MEKRLSLFSIYKFFNIDDLEPLLRFCLNQVVQINTNVIFRHKEPLYYYS